MLNDISFDFTSGSSSEAKDRNIREFFLQKMQLSVIFSEILSPVADSVNFIDDKPLK